MKVLLISGLGPGHLENEDLFGSSMDPRVSAEHMRSQYIISGLDYSPANLFYRSDDDHELVLKQIEIIPPELISNVLKSILKNHRISYEVVPINKVWTNQSCLLEGDIVCLSTSFMWSEGMLDYSLNWIKKNITYKFLIIGGQYGTLKKEYLLRKHPEINYLITGDAEISLGQLINLIKENKHTENILNIPNVTYRDSNKNILSTHVAAGDIETYDRVDFEGNWYSVPYISMKGCPYSCKFCALRVSTPKWRYLSADRIIADWKTYIEKNNVKHIDIMDSTFFIPFSRIQKLLDLIPPLNIIWEANARADTPLTPELVKKLEESHCCALYFGFESMSNLVLGYIDKKTTAQDNRRINELFKDSKINTRMSFIVGFPGETPAEHEKTKQYLINEHFGHYNIYRFEFEDESMPIWKDKDKFDLKIFNESDSIYDWQHGGESWSHIGMDSVTAKKLRAETIKAIRLSESQAVHSTWQYRFQWPFIAQLSRQENIHIEKLIDRLVFVGSDHPNEIDRINNILEIIKKLESFNIFIRQ